MNISDAIAAAILELLGNEGGTAEIGRNELAGRIGCVPSQINYVITSRFTPEQGFIVESRRGGGGYIRITRIRHDKGGYLMHVLNSIGDSLDLNLTRIILENLCIENIISPHLAPIILAAVSERALAEAEAEKRPKLRASIFKQILLSLIN